MASRELYQVVRSGSFTQPNFSRAVLELVRGLLGSAELVNLGGNFLPPMLQDDELQRIQGQQRVSLSLQVYNQGIGAWQAGWNQLAEQFDQQAYELRDDLRSVPVPRFQTCRASTDGHTAMLCAALQVMQLEQQQ